MKVIRTVCGDIAPDELGITSVHDHVLMDSGDLDVVLGNAMEETIESVKGYHKGSDIVKEMLRRKLLLYPPVPKRDIEAVIASPRYPADSLAATLDNQSYYANELTAFREAGGSALCNPSPVLDCSLFDELRALSQLSGVHLLGCVGFYTKPSIPKELLAKGEDQMAKIVQQLLDNSQAPSRPGFVKCAISLLNGAELSWEEHTAVRACARAAKASGYSLQIHTAFPVRNIHVLQLADELIQEIGINPDRVVFCHMDDFCMGFNMSAKINRQGYDPAVPLKLAEMGFNLGFDTWSVTLDNEVVAEYALHARKAMLKEMISKGYASHIVFGHDFVSVKSNSI